MDDNTICWTAFAGEQQFARGEPASVALAVKHALRTQTDDRPILTFDDATGRTVDFDVRGSDAEVAARVQSPRGSEPTGDAGARSPGRPKLGVVSKEITLLPRHWSWLAEQPGGASVTLRKLVEAASRHDHGKATARRAQAAADAFMSAMLGDRPGYEDAARALYAADETRFIALTHDWPMDLRDHARRLAAPAFQTKADASA